MPTEASPLPPVCVCVWNRGKKEGLMLNSVWPSSNNALSSLTLTLLHGIQRCSFLTTTVLLITSDVGTDAVTVNTLMINAEEQYQYFSIYPKQDQTNEQSIQWHRDLKDVSLVGPTKSGLLSFQVDNGLIIVGTTVQGNSLKQ